jgi:hypothetical protein
MKTVGFIRASLTVIVFLSMTNGAFGQSTYRLEVLWNDTLLAGDTIPLKARIINQLGNTVSDTAVINRLSWSIDPASIDSSDKIFSVTPDSVLLTGERFRTVQILITLNNTLPLVDTSIAILIVAPGPDHLVIEPAGTPLPNNDNPIGTIIFGPAHAMELAYAVLRDRFQNFAGYSTAAQWSSTDTTIFSVNTGNTGIGECLVTRRADTGHAFLIARDTVLDLRDTVPVVLQYVHHTTLRIYSLNGPNKQYPDTISITSDASRTLYAEGRRSDDTTRWDPVLVQWVKTAGLKTAVNPPASFTASWNVVPDSVGSGWITITYPGASPDSVFVIVSGDSPKRLVLYRRPGDPSLFIPFPEIDTIRPGTTDTLVAKIFDRNGTWLPEFEDSAVSRKVLSWSIQKINGPIVGDTLSVRTGHSTTFTPKTAYCTYMIIATYQDSAQIRVDSAKIFVLPVCCPTQWVIIPEGPVILSANEQSKSVCSIIRDQYGNFVRYSATTQWSSSDTTIFRAITGDTSHGECVVTRCTDSGQAFLVAKDTVLNIRDSVLVILTNATTQANKYLYNKKTDYWSISSFGSTTRLHIPLHGTHLIKAYSLFGGIIYSSRTSANDAEVKLPKGVFIISVQTIGSTARFTTKIINQ